MKTAIIKTGVWMDDDVLDLNSDTRLVYLCLLTNPNRDLLPAFRCSDSMLSAYTGYSKDLIKNCRQQLIDAGRIHYRQGYYVFTKQDFVKPATGNLSGKIYEREYDKLPVEIKELIEKLHEKTTGSTTGTRTGHIYINKDINNDKDINTEAIRLAELLRSSIQENFSFVKCKNADIPKWAADIEKINRLDGYDYFVIEAVLKWSQNDDFWKQNIQSGAKLRKQFTRLLVGAKVETDNNKSRVVIAGQDDIQTGN